MLTSSDIAMPRAAIHPDGSVEGYASLFGAIDQANDMVMPGAFSATLRQRDIRRIPMLFQHDPAEPIGIWLELTEDWLGLRVHGRLIPEVARAKELLALLRTGAADGLSIGFRTVRGRIDPKTRVRRLHQVDLWEISLVTFPLLAGARVRAVKDARLPSRPRLSSPSLIPPPPPPFIPPPLAGEGRVGALAGEGRVGAARARAEDAWRMVSRVPDAAQRGARIERSEMRDRMMRQRPG